jgi:hypothetical protein
MNRPAPSLTLALLLFACSTFAGSAFAEGAGGLLFGLVQPKWNPSFMPAVPDTLPDFEYMGGFGYGVTRDGTIIGGFGLAFLDYEIYDPRNWRSSSQVPMHVAGGAGGLIVGSRVFGSASSHLDIAARLGMGGLGLATKDLSAYSSRYEPRGYAIVYAEPYVELGLGLTRWMHVSATFGYPYIGNLLPGKPLSALAYYTPTIGATVTFGSF